MTDDSHELEARAQALRRVVYGTPDGFESDAATELETIEQRLAALRPRPIDVAPPERQAPDASAEDDAAADPASESPSPSPGPSHARSVTIAAFAAVLAVAVGLGATAAVGVSGAPRGLAVFDRVQEPGDESLTVALGRQADTVRKLGELFGRGFWAYRNGADRVCLSVVPMGTDLVERGECASTSRFQEHGIAVQYLPDELGRHRPPESTDGHVVSVTWTPESAELVWELVPIAQ